MEDRSRLRSVGRSPNHWGHQWARGGADRERKTRTLPMNQTQWRRTRTVVLWAYVAVVLLSVIITCVNIVTRGFWPG